MCAVTSDDGKDVTRERFYRTRRLPKRRIFEPGDKAKRKVRRFMVPRAVAEAELVMSKCSLKTTSFEAFVHNLVTIRPVWRIVNAYYGSVTHRSRRLEWDARRRSGLAYVLDFVIGHRQDRANVVIAFGAGFRKRRSQPGEKYGPCPGACARPLARKRELPHCALLCLVPLPVQSWE